MSLCPPGNIQPARVNTKEIQMPKGQQRSNRETKKPKQPKKVTVPASSSTMPQRSVPVPGKNK
jgi:hypothetical protein